MELLEYIKKNYKTPNVAVLRTLGASEELIEYLTNTPWNTNMKVIEGLISGGGSNEGKQGLKSITISPAITTTPALDSMFPIYWDDLPEGEIEEGVEYREYTATLHTGHALTNDDRYSVSITPTPGWHYLHGEESGGDGETLTVELRVFNGKLSIAGEVYDHENVKSIVANIIIME